MRQPERYYFLISHEHLSEHCRVHGADVFDMLRYDRAVVESSQHGYWILSCEPRVTEARWRSFGIKIEGPWPSRCGVPYELLKWVESKHDEVKVSA